MLFCSLPCEEFIRILYESMESNKWIGFDKWMCFRCGKTFSLEKTVSYDHNTLMLMLSSCDHPACSYCNRCFREKRFVAPLLITDFQQFNLLRLDAQCISFLQEVANYVVNEADEVCNKCFLFNLLVCFIRAKIYRHVLDATGAAFNLGIGAICTVKGVIDGVGHWSKSDFIDFARRLDAADDAAAVLRIIDNLLTSFGYHVL